MALSQNGRWTPPGTGLELEVIPIPGHSLEQVAVAVDGVLLAADGLFMPEVIARHPITFVVNVAEYLNNLERIGQRPERYVLPGHGPLVDRDAEEADSLPAILSANRAAMGRVQEAILTALEEPLTLEELLVRVVEALGKRLESEPQYFLDRAAISAHLTDLMAREQVRVEFRGGRRFLVR